jgi:hypothetical protein
MKSIVRLLHRAFESSMGGRGRHASLRALGGLAFAVLSGLAGSAAQACAPTAPEPVRMRHAPGQAAVWRAYGIVVRGVPGCAYLLETVIDPAASGLILEGERSSQTLRVRVGRTREGAHLQLDGLLGQGILDAAGIAQLPVFVAVEPGQWPDAGRFRGNLQLRYESVGPDGRLQRLVLDWPFEVEVEPVMRIALQGPGGGAGGLARLDFGQLQQGARGEVWLHVQANTAYRLEIDSRHRGRLRNEVSIEASVPYSLTVDGQTLQLSAPVSIVRPLAAIAGGHSVHRLAVAVGVVERVLAGTYSDELTLSIRAQ